MSGSVTLQAKTEIPPGERPFLKKVKLRGGFGVEAGSFSKPDTQESVNKLSAGAEGEKDASDPETVLTDLTGQAALEDSTVRFSDLYFWSSRCCLPYAWNLQFDQPQDRPARPAESGHENIEHHQRDKSNLAEND